MDAVPGSEPRDITTKRFPTWGDATDLIEIIDVQPEGGSVSASTGRFRTTVPCSDWRRPVVEGSQILGQSIVAASVTHRGAGWWRLHSSSRGPPTRGRRT